MKSAAKFGNFNYAYPRGDDHVCLCAGDQGDKGDRGPTERGPKGAPGAPGLPGKVTSGTKILERVLNFCKIIPHHSPNNNEKKP